MDTGIHSSKYGRAWPLPDNLWQQNQNCRLLFSNWKIVPFVVTSTTKLYSVTSYGCYIPEVASVSGRSFSSKHSHSDVLHVLKRGGAAALRDEHAWKNLAKRDSQCREIWATRGNSHTQKKNRIIWKFLPELLRKKPVKSLFSLFCFVRESPFWFWTDVNNVKYHAIVINRAICWLAALFILNFSNDVTILRNKDGDQNILFGR